jgi:fermentation-respiration switch protein FrsA (DUF1100 family)
LAAKAVVYGLTALAAGEITAFGSFLGGVPVLRASVPHPALSQSAVLRAVAMTGAYLTLVGLIGLGLGALIRHSAAAVATLIGGLFVLPLLVGAGTHRAGEFLPELIAGNSLSAVKPVPSFTLSLDRAGHRRRLLHRLPRRRLLVSGPPRCLAGPNGCPYMVR